MRKNFMKFIKLFSLEDDCASYDEIHERMVSGAIIRGTNLWILVLAIFIASVGLNMNSTAVIIGAMLISPLMCSIMAIGYGLATDDMELAKNSMKKLVLQVALCIVTSTIYFVLSPISEAKSELLARTYPTAWDVVIACCGGLAGVIGMTRKEKTNVIPGVAIATALMPPLCTAGYAISILSIKYFFGAMYLFFINGFFICLSTSIVIMLLRFPKKSGITDKARKKIHRNILIIAIITVIPSIYLGYHIVLDSITNNNISKYLENEFSYENTQVLKYTNENNRLTVTLIGHELSDKEIKEIKKAKNVYNLSDLDVEVKQLSIADEDLKELIKENKNLKEDEKEIDELEAEILAYKSDDIDVEEVTKELKVLFPKIKSCSIGCLSNYDEETKGSNKEVYIILKLSEGLTDDEVSRIESYLKVVTKKEKINIIQQ